MSQGTADTKPELEKIQEYWNAFASNYTDNINSLTIEFAKIVHSHMNFEQAETVVEIAAGAGVGTCDILEKLPKNKRMKVTALDYSPAMVDLAIENVSKVAVKVEDDSSNLARFTYNDTVDVNIGVGNALDLSEISSNSVDTYIANMCLQLVPDADQMLKEARRVLKSNGMVGFSVWGKKENSGLHTIPTFAAAKAGLFNGKEIEHHKNYKLTEDLDLLRKRFNAAGFERVYFWPHRIIFNTWTGEDFIALIQERFHYHLPKDVTEMKERLIHMKEAADEWLQEGKPIGFESYIVIAFPN